MIAVSSLFSALSTQIGVTVAIALPVRCRAVYLTRIPYCNKLDLHTAGSIGVGERAWRTSATAVRMARVRF